MGAYRQATLPGLRRCPDSGNRACFAPSVAVLPVSVPLFTESPSGKTVAACGLDQHRSRVHGATSALRLEATGHIDYVPCVKKLLRVTISRTAAVRGVAAALSLAAVLPAARAVASAAGHPLRGLDISPY